MRGIVEDFRRDDALGYGIGDMRADKGGADHNQEKG